MRDGGGDEEYSVSNARESSTNGVSTVASEESRPAESSSGSTSLVQSQKRCSTAYKETNNGSDT